MSEHLRDHSDGDSDVAIVGMAGRFPRSPDLEAFWRNLRSGTECITFFSDEELEAAGVPAAVLADPSYVKAAGMVEGIELFDAALFGFSPREAEITDPQQRMLLEVCWEALETAGYDPTSYPGRVGVFAGMKLSTYLLNLYSHPELIATMGEGRVLHANLQDLLAAWVSFKLDLTGPSLTVQSACSTSLVAVHLGCQSLLNGECDMVLAGGVGLVPDQRSGYFYQRDDILSPDGHCRAFDARAAGMVCGNGAGVVVLKTLADALQDSDTIHAVIKGSAVNNDGALKAGYAAPSQEGQARVIAEALAVAGLDPAAIDYVEAHGTGTALGDPVEVAALNQAFAGRSEPCALGSVKTNIGHLDPAAGVAGLIKAVLSLEHREIPPSLHFETPNPRIDFDRGPFYVNRALAAWPDRGRPRRAGVSAFGMGGTNCHLVLEEAPAPEPSEASRSQQLLVLSAATPAALEAVTLNLAAHLRRNPVLELADAAFTLAVGRRALRHRRLLVASGRDEAIAALAGEAPRRLRSAAVEYDRPPVVFLFPGQGAQQVGMAAELYAAEPAFRRAFDRCTEHLGPLLGRDLGSLLYPGAGEEAAAAEILSKTAFTQPALFAVEYALAELWREWGVEPEAMIGHSVGEYVAACLAGVFTLADSLRLVALRGRLMQELPAGAMLSVPLSEERVLPHLGGELALAAVNAADRSTVSGPCEAVDALAERLAAHGVECRRLRTSHAFHSPMMDSVVPRFKRAVAEVAKAPPRLPWISNLTATWVRPDEVTGAEYWVRHLRETVRFAPGITTLLEEERRVFLEVGPGQSLTGLVRRQAVDRRAVVPSLPRHGDDSSDSEAMLWALGRLWLTGVRVDWPGVYRHQARRHVPLPTYPFERRRYWVERRPLPAARHEENLARREAEDWFYTPTWKQVPLPVGPPGEEAERWLLFVEPGGLGQTLARLLAAAGAAVVTVEPGASFEPVGEGAYRVPPGDHDGFARLFAALRQAEWTPQKVVHAWCVEPVGEAAADPAGWLRRQRPGFFSLLALFREIAEGATDASIEVEVLSSGLHDVVGNELLQPERATLLGPCRVAPREIPGLRVRSIDVAPPPGGGREALAARLVVEMTRPISAAVVAYRGPHRWVQDFEPLPVAASAGEEPRLRQRGVYLIVGGLGGIGLELAAYLARAKGARLVLVGRSPLPPRESWPEILVNAAERREVQDKIRRLQAIEELGGEVLVAAADVCDRRRMAEVLAAARRRFGPIHGVVQAAGLPGSSLIALKSEEEAAAVLAPKVAGTLVLSSLFAGEQLDFLLLCSSVASILGGPGQVDYCGANAFLDAFARRNASSPGAPFTLSVGWCAWQEVGMAEAERRAPESAAERQQRLAVGLRPAEGIEALRRALGSGLPHVIVSTQSLRALLAVAAAPVRDAAEEQAAIATYPRPELAHDYVAPRNRVEEVIAEIWQRLLGVETVGVHDDFSELGGDSLVGLRVLSRLRQRFAIEMPLRTLFDRPTVAELALAVVELQAAGADEAELASALEEIQGLSRQEVEELLAADGALGEG